MSRSTANPGMRLVTPASFLDVVRGPWRHLLGEGNVTLSFQRDDVWHVPNVYACAGPGETKRVSFKLTEVGDENLCPECFGHYLRTGHYEQDKIFKQVKMFLDYQKAYAVYSPMTPTVGARTIQWRREQIASILNELNQRAFPNELWPVVSELHGKYESLTEVLKEASTSEAVRVELAHLVQKELMPRRMEGEDAWFDKTPALIGISALSQVSHLREPLVSVLSAYSISAQDDAVVLYAPLYFYAYLSGKLLFEIQDSPVMLTCALAPKDASVYETAAKLWEPESRTPLGSLSGAVATAEALQGD